ncbi:hypothetical protein [Actinomadura citrea]|uniref:Uncharacterized protein n=1 Tax=Actinomadura citrea TaxID=46158 RepID=A0A7Y9GA60_9ACTN|nr:hypothetical protein [Actinomadura citrea]NYE12717.1 hypothetical protein [Actinomadura citrea]GGT53976.1 hypothetical protein GCM10010177_07750 [Actinomadura citrea]
MIILSGVLVVVAIALLVAGIVAGNGDSAQVFGLDALVVIYISIAVSIVSAVCLAIGVFLRRKELFGPGASPGPARPSKKAQKAKKDKRAKRKDSAPAASVPAKDAQGAVEAKPPADPADDEVEIPAPAVDVPDDTLVFVVRGRKRYHLDTCRQLAGRDTEELTYAEAKEEGFSPCTACLPDTALAARAAASAPASSDASKAAGTAPAARKPGAERSESGLAGLAKPAPTSFDEPGAFDKPTSFDEPGAFDEPSSFDKPSSFDEPSSFDKPSAFDKPGGFDKTAEIPRAGEHAADEADDRSAEDASAPKRTKAGPTRTDMPVAGLFASGDTAEEASTAPERAESADAEAEDRRSAEQGAATESAPPDVTADLGTAPFGDAGGEDVPAPGHEPSGAELAGEREPEPSAGDAAEESGADGPLVRILSGTKRYHRVDCALIEDIGDEADDLESLSRAEAKARGCTPCLVCQPDREHARD